jgi:hypothetical protein
MYTPLSVTERSLSVFLLLFGLLVSACSTDTAPTDPLEPASRTGEILGRVTGDGAPVSGVAVTLSRSGSELATVSTAANGEFGFRDLDTGVYVVAISGIVGMNCSRQQAASVGPGEERQVNFACVTPPPVGTIEGRVMVNGVGAGGVLVAIRDASSYIATKVTASDGTYRFTGVRAGAKSVWISTEEDCPGTHQENGRRGLEVSVGEGEVAVADFACTGQAITGRVTVNGIPQSGLLVLVCYSSNVWDDGCVGPEHATDSEGRYAYTSLGQLRGTFPPGSYFVFVQDPTSSMICPERPAVSVSSDLAVTVDFPCVQG